MDQNPDQQSIPVATQQPTVTDYAKKIHDAAVRALAGVSAEGTDDMGVERMEMWHLRLSALFALVNQQKAEKEQSLYKFMNTRLVDGTKSPSITEMERRFFDTRDGQDLIMFRAHVESIHKITVALSQRQKRLSQPFAV